VQVLSNQKTSRLLARIPVRQIKSSTRMMVLHGKLLALEIVYLQVVQYYISLYGTVQYGSREEVRGTLKETMDA
jgi:hypothetical protein